jgi:uncharacterized Ntn-hydrolase superfamily protein
MADSRPCRNSPPSGKIGAMTFSLLVRDPVTGALGAAVASKFFAVGALCIHVEGGVAALATQALINPMYAPHGMALLRAGEAPENVVNAMTLPDPGRDQRQLHIIDAQGRIGQHTGPDCVTWAGHVRGTDVSAAGNMLAGPRVVEAMLEGLARTEGSLAERLIAGLEAGEAAGGDKRGRQSAAVKVCVADPYPELDIRADDHPDPLTELRRLHRVSLERYAVFRRFLAGTRDPWGTYDRAVIEAAIQNEGAPP